MSDESGTRRLKATKRATRDRLRKRAYREKQAEEARLAVRAKGFQDAEAAAIPFRDEDEAQAAFLKEGPPTKAKPGILAAWHRAAAMTPSERQEAREAQRKRFVTAAGLPLEDTDIFGILPPDGSGDPNDDSTYGIVAFWSKKRGGLVVSEKSPEERAAYDKGMDEAFESWAAKHADDPQMVAEARRFKARQEASERAADEPEPDEEK